MSDFTVSAYSYKANGAVVRFNSTTGYKTRGMYLCEAIGLRYVGRARGYVGTQTQADRVARLYAAGWGASMPLFSKPAPCAPDEVLPEPWMRRRGAVWVRPAAIDSH